MLTINERRFFGIRISSSTFLRLLIWTLFQFSARLQGSKASAHSISTAAADLQHNIRGAHLSPSFKFSGNGLIISSFSLFLGSSRTGVPCFYFIFIHPIWFNQDGYLFLKWVHLVFFYFSLGGKERECCYQSQLCSFVDHMHIIYQR